MKQFLLIAVLALAEGVGATNYYVSTTGTAATKSAATGPVSTDANCMPSKLNKSQTYVAGDTIFWGYKSGADSNFYDTGTTVFKTPSLGTSTNPVVYMAVPGCHPRINGAAVYTHGATWHWHASATTNYYYLTTAADANPSLTLPANLWVNNFKYNSGTLTSLQDRQCALGDLDGLGYNVIYIRRDAANPATDGVLIEGSVASKYAWTNATAGNGLIVDGLTFTHGTTTLITNTAQDTNVIIRNCILEKSFGLFSMSYYHTFQVNNCKFRDSYNNSTRTLQISSPGQPTKEGDGSFNFCTFENIGYDGIYSRADSAVTIKINNCTFYGIGATAVGIASASRANIQIKNCIFNTVQVGNLGNGFILENATTVGGVLGYKNSFIGKPAVALTHATTSACADSGGNVTKYSPIFKHHRRPIIFSWTNDDSQDWGILRDSLRVQRDSVHCPMTQAFNFTNGGGTLCVYILYGTTRYADSGDRAFWIVYNEYHTRHNRRDVPFNFGDAHRDHGRDRHDHAEHGACGFSRIHGNFQYSGTRVGL